MQQKNKPSAIGTPDYVYGKVLKIIEKYNVKKVLDCPAGNGAFSIQLINNNYEVSACDINPEIFKVRESVICKYADMNNQLPYDNESLDAVVCLNGMHRVWARGRAIGEFERVLKKNGVLIITNVNNINLVHRLSYLACGAANYNTLGPPFGFLPEAEVPAAWYRSPMTITEVVSIGTSCNLVVDHVELLSVSLKSIILSPISILSMFLALFLPKKFHEHCYINIANSFQVLFSDYLALIFKKNNN